MLEKTLAETDPDTTDVAVMTAQVDKPGDTDIGGPELNEYARNLMSAVVERAEKAGKHVQPLIVRTNNPLYAVINAARDLNAQEAGLGGVERLLRRRADRADRLLLDQFAPGRAAAADDPHPGSQPRSLFRHRRRQPHPQAGRAQARSVAELREAGVGISRVLVVHDRTPAGSDLFADVLTMLDPQVALTLAPLPKPAASPSDDPGEADRVEKDLDRAKQLRREVTFRELPAGETCTQIAALAAELKCNLIIVGKQEASAEQASLDCDAVVRQASCAVCVVTLPNLPQEAGE